MVVTASLWTTTALADPAMCASVSERGQQARAAGKLIEARQQFLACSATHCPPVIATDCATWAAEVLQATPTIVIDAKDQSGHDVGDATLMIDGRVMTHQLDGKAIPVDPGSHTIDVSANTMRGTAKHVTDTFIAKEAEKARVVRVLVPAPGPAEQPEKAEPASHHSALPWVLVGIGAAFVVTGTVLALVSYPDGCDPDATSEDGKEGVCAGPNATENQSTAGTVKHFHLYGPIMMIAGGAMLAGGLAWHFLEKPSASAMIAPWYDVASGGLMMKSTF